jgi:hypothetical protein
MVIGRAGGRHPALRQAYDRGLLYALARQARSLRGQIPWRGIAAPESPEFLQACVRLGARPAFLPADQFGRLIAKEDPELAS